MSFILLGILNSQVTGAGGGAYELIESNILTSSASSVTFSSIPQDYKHLQIRAVMRTNGSGSDELDLRINSDTGSNYAFHRLLGTGSSVVSAANTSTSYIRAGIAAPSSDSANIFGVSVIDILDYANTSKNTTIRNLTGRNGGSNLVQLGSGLWNNTAAVTTLNLFDINGQSFITGSRFSLYGIRG